MSALDGAATHEQEGQEFEGSFRSPEANLRAVGDQTEFAEKPNLALRRKCRCCAGWNVCMDGIKDQIDY